MPLRLVSQDIVAMEVGAVVNAANNQLAMGGGVCGAIFKAAGASELSKECQALGGCKTGEAVITSAYNLPAKKIIHTVGPVWYGGNSGERRQLTSSYKSSLTLAKQNGLDSIAFPLLSAGIFGYPRQQAAEVAVEAIGEYLYEDPDMVVYLIILGSKGEFVDPALLSNIYKIEALNYGPDSSPFSEQLGTQIANMMGNKGLKPNELAAKSNLKNLELKNILYGVEPNQPTLLAIGIGLELGQEDLRALLAYQGPWALSDKRLQLANFFLEKGQTDIHKINLNNFALDFDTLP
ncbi:MAG: macro domain-containing protein [Deltaproteobacteria bacterium]|nr:macro domain-containing protein [Deltaproteobacteria bacterium]